MNGRKVVALVLAGIVAGAGLAFPVLSAMQPPAPTSVPPIVLPQTMLEPALPELPSPPGVPEPPALAPLPPGAQTVRPAPAPPAGIDSDNDDDFDNDNGFDFDNDNDDDFDNDN